LKQTKDQKSSPVDGPYSNNNNVDMVREMWIQCPSNLIKQRMHVPKDYYSIVNFENIENWKIDDVLQWLKDIGLSHLRSLFQTLQVDGQKLINLFKFDSNDYNNNSVALSKILSTLIEISTTTKKDKDDTDDQGKEDIAKLNETELKKSQSLNKIDEFKLISNLRRIQQHNIAQKEK